MDGSGDRSDGGMSDLACAWRMLKLDFVPIQMEVQEDGLSITSGYTDLSLS